MTANQTKILKIALFDFALSEANYFEALDVKEPSYSDTFKSKIKELSQQKSKSSPTSKRVTFILIAAVIAVMLVASASAIVIGFGDYLVNIYEKYIEVKFDNGNDAKLTIKEIYAPTYIPNGYLQIDESSHNTNHSYLWSNGTHNLAFEQETHNRGGLTTDNESIEYQSFVLDGKTVYYYTKYNTIFLIWSSEKYVFSINCSSDIPLDEIKLMISSMSLDNSKTD